MTDFKCCTFDDVPGPQKDVPATVENAYGLVPNLLASTVESRGLAEAYPDRGESGWKAPGDRAARGTGGRT